MRTSKQIMQQTNELASKFYALRGNKERPGYRFDQATHPQEVKAWEAACIAQRMLTNTDPMDALSDMEDEEE